MRWIPLLWLTERLARPVGAVIAPSFGADRDEDFIPDNAVVFRVACPSARVMIHVPNAVPGAVCYDALDEGSRLRTQIAWERWKDRFLAEAIVDPPMTEATIQTLGPDADALAIALLKLWNWIPETDGALPNMPGAAFQDALRFLSIRLRRSPSEILAAPFDAFVLDYRILRGPVRDEAEVPESEVTG